MENNNPKWMEYLKTFIPIFILLGSFIVWYASQTTRISTLETKQVHNSKHVAQCQHLQKQSEGFKYRISTLESSLKTLIVQVNSLNPIIPQVKRNTQNIQFILSKLDRHQDLLIEVRTLVKTILDKHARQGVMQPRRGTKTLRR